MNTALLYHLALFLHIVGALGLVGALTFETIGLRGLRRAVRRQDALIWLGIARVVQRLAPGSLGLILVMGLYMMATEWGPRAWILVSLGAFAAILLIGGLLTGVRMARIGPAVGHAEATLSEEMQRALRDRALLISLRTRLGLVVGVVFLMSVKPSLLASLVVIGAATGSGLLAGVASTGGRNALQPQAS